MLNEQLALKQEIYILRIAADVGKWLIDDFMGRSEQSLDWNH